MLAVPVLVVMTSVASGDIERKLERVHALYDRGRYADVLPLVDQVRKAQGATRAQRMDAIKHQAFALYLLKSYDDARRVWLDLLGLEPGYRLDAVETSPELMAFFERVKPERPPAAPAVTVLASTPAATNPPAQSAPAASAMTGTAAPVDAAAAEQRTISALPAGAQPPSEAQTSPVSLPTASCAPYLCLVPFGVGQFAKGDTWKGVAFASTEAAFVAANLTLYWTRVRNYQEHGRVDDVGAANRSFMWQQIFFGLFVATAAGGVLDAYLVH